jgi:putative Mn2+ efflux pump MntP
MHSFLEILLISLALAVDAFAVAAASGAHLKKIHFAQPMRMALCFGLFQSGMTLIGIFLGEGLSRLIGSIDHWVAFGLLLLAGLHMIYEAISQKGDVIKSDPTRGWRLIMLGVATSIDALAVGVSFVVLQLPVILSVICIGVVAFFLTVIGMFVGHKAVSVLKIGKYAEVIGGVVLMGIGVKILLAHA